MNDSSLRNARILIVDDEVAVTCLLVNFLNRLGYKQIKALQDSSLVFDEFASFKPDLLMLDISMRGSTVSRCSGGSGPRSGKAAFPVLMMTGHLTTPKINARRSSRRHRSVAQAL